MIAPLPFPCVAAAGAGAMGVGAGRRAARRLSYLRPSMASARARAGGRREAWLWCG